MRSHNENISQRVLDLPELNVVLFAFLLHFVWEFWQVPFFRDLPTAPHWEAIQFCTLATAGDALIALITFWAIAGWARSRRWILEPRRRHVLAFALGGIAITVAAEYLATEVLHRWAYAEQMPTLPVLGTGLLPVLQWTLVPPLVVWFVRRQLT